MQNLSMLTDKDFWPLVDAVLVMAKRPVLPTGKNDPERAIIRIQPSDRVLQILAGPGAGKTEMLVWRVLYDLVIIGTDPKRVMVTTFTRKAAEELTVRLAERTESLLKVARMKHLQMRDPKTHDVRIGTIHSLCDQLLAEHIDGYRDQAIRLLDEMEADLHRRWWWWKPLGLSRVDKAVRAVVDKYPAVRSLLTNQVGNPDMIDLLRSLLCHQTETWLARSNSGNIKNGLEHSLKYVGLTDAIENLRSGWISYLIDGPKALDFTTIQSEFLENQEEMVNSIDHLYVDEFQDTNPIQYQIHLGWLSTKNRNSHLPSVRLTVVGDDDQSIYRFRGSDVGCFINLESNCVNSKVPFRKEVMERNNRSSKAIVEFTKSYREKAIPKGCTLAKTITPVKPVGVPVRLISGPWDAVCAQVAREVIARNYGKGKIPNASMAALMFSTSEGDGKPAKALREALESKDVLVDNPRNKIAGKVGSHVHTLTGLMSYFIDPLTRVINPDSGRYKQSAASKGDDVMDALAVVAEPKWKPPNYHLLIQSKLIQEWCGKDNLGPSARSTDTEFNAILDYLNSMRERIAAGCIAYKSGTAKSPRLTLAGLIARLLTMPFFRNTGYTIDMFRQALFTEIAEAAIAASRGTGFSIDEPISAEVDANGKVAWDSRVWDFIGSVGLMVYGAGLDDPEVDAFQDGAFRMLTFHQSKGLEFDEVYVAATGRHVDIIPVLVTKLFSGEPIKISFDSLTGNVTTTDPTILEWAKADAAREVYVALTRAKERLTILHDPDHEVKFMALDSDLGSVFKRSPVTYDGKLSIKKWTP